ALDPNVATPHNRFMLTRFSDDPAATLVGAYRARAISRVLAAVVPLPAAGLVALNAPSSLVGGPLGIGCLALVVALASFFVLREIAVWLAWGGPRSDRYRDALESELSRRLGMEPVVVRSSGEESEGVAAELVQ